MSLTCVCDHTKIGKPHTTICSNFAFPRFPSSTFRGDNNEANSLISIIGILGKSCWSHEYGTTVRCRGGILLLALFGLDQRQENSAVESLYRNIVWVLRR